jgi:hypothetical protein
MTHTELMTLVQEFASAWSLVGSRFDSGDALETAEAAKAALSDALLKVVQDAERYNWIRLTSAGTDFVVEELQDTPPSTWNEAINAAMQEKPE